MTSLLGDEGEMSAGGLVNGAKRMRVVDVGGFEDSEGGVDVEEGGDEDKTGDREEEMLVVGGRKAVGVGIGAGRPDAT
jgi:hypothetical protein